MRYENKHIEKKHKHKAFPATLAAIAALLPVQMYENADSYLHYSNNLLFELNRDEATASLLILIHSYQKHRLHSALLKFADETPPEENFEIYKEELKSFDGVIDRYCGVPP